MKAALAILLAALCLALGGCGTADVDSTSAPGAYSNRDSTGDADSDTGTPPKGMHMMPGGAGFTHNF